MLNPKQHNIATGPQGQRWSDDMIKSDERWENQAERDLGPAYRADVAKTHAGESSHYYPGQGGPGTQSQGKLFHDPKPTDPVRWPRGYTPERQSDVEVSIAPFTGGYGGLQQGDEILAARTRNTVARSSMPERDLSSVSKGFEDPIEIMQKGGPGFTGGSYIDKHRRVALGDNVNAHTVLHEMGHAVSAARKTDGMVGDQQVASNWQSASATGGVTFGKVAGAEEARADIYGTRHAKRMSGEPHLRTDDYDPSHYQYGYEQRYAETAFAQEYANEHMRQGVERPSEIKKRQRGEEQKEQRAQSLGPPKPSPHLFQRPGKYESIDHPMPTEPDFGQYGATAAATGEDIGTIPVSGGLPQDISNSVLRRQRQTDRLRKERGL